MTSAEQPLRTRTGSIWEWELRSGEWEIGILFYTFMVSTIDTPKMGAKIDNPYGAGSEHLLS